MICVSPKIVSCHTVDASSLKTVVAKLIKPTMTSEEKALAIWRFCWEHTYHWPAPREGSRTIHELDTVYDAVKQLNVYGYTYCFAIRSLAEALYEAAGLEARSGGIGGHVIAETYFDGRYHYLDHDQRGFSRLADGTIAALTDYRDRPKQVFDPAGRSRPYFPSESRPWAPYEQKLVFAGYLAGQTNHYRQHDKYRAMHAMTLALRPAERFIRCWDNVGKWHWSPGLADGYMDPLDGPRDPYYGLHRAAPCGENGAARAYGNGLLLYRPNLGPRSRDFEDGVTAQANIRRAGTGFGPRRAGRPAHADFRVRLPYIIVGWPQAVDKPDIVGAAVVSGRCWRQTAADQVGLAVSTDDGATWKTVWTARALGESAFAVDLSRHVEGRYGYTARFILNAAKTPRAARILDFGMDTACQVNPAVLPAVRPGRNRMTLALESGPEAYEAFIQYGERGLATHKRLCRSMTGLRIQKAAISRLAPKTRGKPGNVVYEMAAPKGQTIAWAKVGGAFRSNPPPKHGELFRMNYALDNDRRWTPLWEADLPPYLGHWCFEAERDIPLPRPARKIRVRYELQRAPDPDSEGGSLVEARLAWGCEAAPPAMPAGGILATHEWREGTALKRRRKMVARSGQSYGFQVQAASVTNVSVAVEWAARPPVDDTPHPKMLARPAGMPVDAELDRKRERMRADLARLNRKPTLATVLDLKKNGGNAWVRDSMSAALIAMKGPAAERARRETACQGDKRVGNYLEQRLFDRGPLPDLIRLLESDDPRRRIQSARALTRRRLRRAAPALRRALDKEKDATACAAEMAAWIALQKPGALQEPVTLPRACDPDGRREIAAALAIIGHPQAWPLLTEAARDPDPGLRWRVACDLSECGQAEAEPLLIELLADPSRWVRQAATAGLARYGSTHARRALLKMARTDPEPFLRAEARWASGQRKQSPRRAQRGKAATPKKV